MKTVIGILEACGPSVETNAKDGMRYTYIRVREASTNKVHVIKNCACYSNVNSTLPNVLYQEIKIGYGKNAIYFIENNSEVFSDVAYLKSKSLGHLVIAFGTPLFSYILMISGLKEGLVAGIIGFFASMVIFPWNIIRALEYLPDSKARSEHQIAVTNGSIATATE